MNNEDIKELLSSLKNEELASELRNRKNCNHLFQFAYDYSYDDETETYVLRPYIWIVEKSFWEERKCFKDCHISDDLDIPFAEDMESCFECYANGKWLTEDEAREILLSLGLTEISKEE